MSINTSPPPAGGGAGGVDERTPQRPRSPPTGGGYKTPRAETASAAGRAETQTDSRARQPTEAEPDRQPARAPARPPRAAAERRGTRRPQPPQASTGAAGRAPGAAHPQTSRQQRRSGGGAGERHPPRAHAAAPTRSGRPRRARAQCRHRIGRTARTDALSELSGDQSRWAVNVIVRVRPFNPLMDSCGSSGLGGMGGAGAFGGCWSRARIASRSGILPPSVRLLYSLSLSRTVYGFAMFATSFCVDFWAYTPVYAPYTGNLPMGLSRNGANVRYRLQIIIQN